MATRGAIVLMGSGELTSTMVEVHKEQMRRAGSVGPAVFLDTPAGFQSNADQISARAVEYFRTRVGHPMTVASYKVKPALPSVAAQEACRMLELAGLVLIGPGSPTYAVRQWQDSPIPGIIAQRVAAGATLVAASAAALTVGRFTLPVYEIYKVGESLRWEPGIDLLGRFGFNLVVVPHWNNAEGGTHDTRRCFMGESRFRELEKMLPSDTSVIGLDEHTACVLDFAQATAEVRGIGRVVLRRGGAESVFATGEQLPLSLFMQGPTATSPAPAATEAAEARPAAAPETSSFWGAIHALEHRFQNGLAHGAPAESTHALLELDRLIWHAAQELESEEFISQGREILREWIVRLGARLAEAPRDRAECLAPCVREMVDLRREFRDSQRWAEADALREALKRADILVEDTPQGPRWRLGEPGAQAPPTEPCEKRAT
jgi:cyanophycinase-like exopeptidase